MKPCGNVDQLAKGTNRWPAPVPELKYLKHFVCVGIFEDNNAALKLVVDFAEFYRLCKSTEFPEAKLESMEKYKTFFICF